jgi:acetyl esterase/lipase
MRIGTLAAFVFIFSAASGVFAQGQSASAAPGYETVRDILYRDGAEEELTDYMKERCRLDLYYPKDARDYPTVVWFHGGGLTSGERFVPEPLMNRKLAVAAVNYRLSPKVKCLDSIDDAAAAVAWVIENIGVYGGNPSLVFVSGHSAGGYLTAMIGLDKHWLAKYGVDANRIAGLIPFSGHAITHFAIRAERGIPGTQAVVDEYAPLYFVRPDAPPLVLITGDRELEMLGRYEENAYLMRMMKVAGHQNTTLYELQGFDHGGMASPAYFILLRHIEQDGIHRDPEAYLTWLQPILSQEDFLQAAIDLSDLWLQKQDQPISNEASPKNYELLGLKIRLFKALRAMRDRETSAEAKQEAGALLEKIQALQSKAAGKEDLKAIKAGVYKLEKTAQP